MKLLNGELILGDCIEKMRDIPDGSVDMILTDLPYGTTKNPWDSIIPFDCMWKEYWRVCKSNAAVVLTAQTPFDKMLGASQIQYLKYEWIWKKESGTGFLNSKKQPLKNCENVLVFYRNQCVYNPQMTYGTPYKVKRGVNSSNYNASSSVMTYSDGERYPLTLLDFKRDSNNIHPTQKPVALFEYLIKTYTNENDTVLDSCAGSGTTAVAAENNGRRWICIEKDEEMYWKSKKRILNDKINKLPGLQ